MRQFILGKMMRILLLEDDRNEQKIICDFLIELNYFIDIAHDGEEAEELLYTNKYDLLLFDFDVPKISGLELLNKFRCYGYKTPAIIMTSHTTDSMMEEAFKIGCDDFVKKPINFKELLLRINYIRKMFKINLHDVVSISERFSFDSLNLTIIKEEEIISLPKKEALIVKYMLDNKNRIISTEELILHVWDYDSTPSIATIRTYIKNIRKKFENNFIETVKGCGYKFCDKPKTA